MVAKSKMYHLFSCSIPIHSSRPDEDAIALKTVCQKENKVVKSTVVQIISSSSGKPEETTSMNILGFWDNGNHLPEPGVKDVHEHEHEEIKIRTHVNKICSL